MPAADLWVMRARVGLFRKCSVGIVWTDACGVCHSIREFKEPANVGAGHAALCSAILKMVCNLWGFERKGFYNCRPR
jgi:hypothetical protein